MAGPKVQSRQFERSKPFVSCRYCNGKHCNDECQIYPTTEARKQRIKGSCFICHKQAHKTNECTLAKGCYYCHQTNNHHRSLCPRQFGSTIKKITHLVEEVPEEEESDITENILLLSSRESVLMQTAKTEVKNPSNNTK